MGWNSCFAVISRGCEYAEDAVLHGEKVEEMESGQVRLLRGSRIEIASDVTYLRTRV